MRKWTHEIDFGAGVLKRKAIKVLEKGKLKKEKKKENGYTGDGWV